jgi:hypothetical protein
MEQDYEVTYMKVSETKKAGILSTIHVTIPPSENEQYKPGLSGKSMKILQADI